MRFWPRKKRPEKSMGNIPRYESYGGDGWNYIATIEAKTVYNKDKDDEAKTIIYYILLQNIYGERKYIKTGGDGGNSEYAQRQNASVEGWVHGGPLPKWIEHQADENPPLESISIPEVGVMFTRKLGVLHEK